MTVAQGRPFARGTGTGTGGIARSSAAAFAIGVVFTIAAVVVFVLLGSGIGLFNLQNVGAPKPSPNELTNLSWVVIMAGAIAGLTTLRSARRIFSLSAPGPILPTCLGVAVGGLPAGVWVGIYTSSHSALAQTFGSVAMRQFTILLSLACAIALVALRDRVRLVGGGLLGSALTVGAFMIATLTARTGTVRLGLLELIVSDGEVAPTYFSVRFLAALMAALIPAACVAWIGRRRDQPWGEAAIAGAIGPTVLGLAYLFAGNGTVTDADRFRPWLYVQAASALAFLVAAAIARLTDRRGHLSAPPLPHRFRWWGLAVAVGVVGGMLASMFFFNLGPLPFNPSQASEQVAGTFRSYDSSVLVSATLTLIGLAVTLVVGIEAVWSTLYGGRDERRTATD